MMEASIVENVLSIPGMIAAVIVLTKHAKLFFAAMPWTEGAWTEGVPGAPWPLLSDALGVGGAILLWRGGVLDEMVPGYELNLALVILVGVAMGIAASGVVDAKRALRAPAASTG